MWRIIHEQQMDILCNNLKTYRHILVAKEVAGSMMERLKLYENL